MTALFIVDTVRVVEKECPSSLISAAVIGQRDAGALEVGA